MELVAEEEDHSVVASVRVDDTRVSILEYILVRHCIILLVNIVVLR